MGKIGSWYIGIAAEAFAAAQFARYGVNVSVQYGANQPEYDLIAAKGDSMLKISVKGSQDVSWGLTQGFKKDCDYHEAINRWLAAHGKKTVFCLVQFHGVAENELPRMYLATPSEIAEIMHSSRAGNGDTILYEHHVWGQWGNLSILPVLIVHCQSPDPVLIQKQTNQHNRKEQ